MENARKHQNNVLIVKELLNGRPPRLLEIIEASSYIDLCVNLSLSTGRAYEMVHLYGHLENMEDAVKINLILAERRQRQDCPPLPIKLAVERPQHAEPDTWQEWFKEIEWDISRGLTAREDEVSELKTLIKHIGKAKRAAEELKRNLHVLRTM